MFKYGFLKRTIMYGGAGLCGITVDLTSFGVLASYASALPAGVINILAYSFGTLTSFYINRRFSFRSTTHCLSLSRFYLVSIFGMAVSTILLLLLSGALLSLPLSKAVATVIAVASQYSLNTKFSVVKKG